MLLSSCERSLTAVKEKYSNLIKLCIYLHGEADADLIQNLEEQEETLDKGKRPNSYETRVQQTLPTY